MTGEWGRCQSAWRIDGGKGVVEEENGKIGWSRGVRSHAHSARVWSAPFCSRRVS